MPRSLIPPTLLAILSTPLLELANRCGAIRDGLDAQIISENSRLFRIDSDELTPAVPCSPARSRFYVGSRAPLLGQSGQEHLRRENGEVSATAFGDAIPCPVLGRQDSSQYACVPDRCVLRQPIPPGG